MSSLPTFSTEDGILPLEHLQLSVRAQNACRSKGCHSIFDVVAGLNSDTLSIASLGNKTFEELRSAVLEVGALVESGGRVNWDKVWAQRGVATPSLAMTSVVLDRVQSDVRARGLGVLHLRKACSGLAASGITTVGALIDAGRKGIGKLDNFGKTAQEEVLAALQALSKATGPDGAVDWDGYANAHGFPLLPVDPTNSGDPRALVQDLPSLCEKVVKAQLDEREWEILKRRFLVAEKDRETLEELGTVYKVSRERIRQLEAKCLAALRKPIIDEDYRGLEFRLRQATAAQFQSARSYFKSLGLPAWRESRWLAELAALWQVDECLLQKHDELIVEILGYRWQRLEAPLLEPLVLDDSTPETDATKLAKAVVALHEFLRATPQGTDSFEVVRALRKGGIEDCDLETIPVLADLCSTAEVVGTDNRLYRTKFIYLKGRADQAFRVLQEFGQPFHHKDLFREINRRLPERKRLENKENLVGQMCSDGRLQAIGKSGKWALADWQVEGRSLIEVINDVLDSAGEALPVEEITAKALEKRAGSAKSIIMLLDFNSERFHRVARGMYGLTAWGDKSPDGAITDETVAQFVEGYVHSHGGGPVDFKELRRAFEKQSGLSPRSAAGVLASHPGLEVTLVNTYRREAKYLKNWKTSPVKRAYQRSSPLQADRTIEAVTQLLLEAPSGELNLIDVVNTLEVHMGITKPSLYSAIGQAPDIERIAVEGSVLKVLRLRNGKQPKYPQLAQLKSEDWKKECIRAVSKLSVEEVDIGLFLLGRLFDAAMGELLLAARGSGYEVLEGHLKKLSNRIDWALAKGVFHNKTELNLLRNERNERAHENPPPLAERQAQLKVAPTLASLYLDYLVSIEQLITKFQAGQTNHQK